MPEVILGVFFVLHGLIHLLYIGQSQKYFELQPGLVWPDGSWAFSRLLGNKSTRLLASCSLGLAALGFVISGVLIILGHGLWRLVAVSSASISAALFLLFWDGGMRRLDAKGGVGLLINLAILVVVLVLNWPK